MLIQIQENIPLSSFTSWNLGGPARYFFQPHSLFELKEVLAWSLSQGIPYQVLGGGSNVLIHDQGYAGLILQMSKLVGIFDLVSDSNSVTFCAWAGTSKSEILKLCLKERLGAAMFLAGLPGDVGGGVVMNAGVAENFSIREFGKIVDKVYVWDCLTKTEKIFSHDDISWDYRHSWGWQPGVIYRVDFSIPVHKDPHIVEKVRQANKIRLQKQPLDLPSCGSVFINPPGLKAAQLIDECGLKGFQVGRAQVSKKHANFIVNLGQATAADVESLIHHIQAVVWQNKGVALKTEVVRIGFAQVK